MEEETPYYNRITVISDERIDVAELAKAVKKFGTVSAVSSTQSRAGLWDD
jgi:hypothetical protein